MAPQALTPGSMRPRRLAALGHISVGVRATVPLTGPGALARLSRLLGEIIQSGPAPSQAFLPGW